MICERNKQIRLRFKIKLFKMGQTSPQHQPQGLLHKNYVI